MDQLKLIWYSEKKLLLELGRGTSSLIFVCLCWEQAFFLPLLLKRTTMHQILTYSWFFTFCCCCCWSLRCLRFSFLPDNRIKIRGDGSKQTAKAGEAVDGCKILWINSQLRKVSSPQMMMISYWWLLCFCWDPTWTDIRPILMI